MEKFNWSKSSKQSPNTSKTGRITYAHNPAVAAAILPWLGKVAGKALIGAGISKAMSAISGDEKSK